MKLIWLSYPMSTTAPRPPAIPAPSVSEFQSIEKDGANVQFLQCYNHTGTHLDTAAHVLPDGASIVEFAPEELVYRKIKVIDLTGKMLIPGLIDAHCHPLMSAFLTSGILCDAEMTHDQVLETIRAYVEAKRGK